MTSFTCGCSAAMLRIVAFLLPLAASAWPDYSAERSTAPGLSRVMSSPSEGLLQQPAHHGSPLSTRSNRNTEHQKSAKRQSSPRPVLESRSAERASSSHRSAVSSHFRLKSTAYSRSPAAVVQHEDAVTGSSFVDIPLRESAQKNGKYLIDAAVGTGEGHASQVMMLSMNAPFTWVAGAECENCEPLPPATAKFDSSKSSSWSNGKTPFNDTMSFEYDAAKGVLGQDMVHIRGTKATPPSPIAKHIAARLSELEPLPLPFGVVQHTRREGMLFGNGFSGILGLAPDSSNSLVTGLRSKGLISASLAALDLDVVVGDEDDEHQRTECVRENNFDDRRSTALRSRKSGVLRIGAVDSEKFDLMHWFPVMRGAGGKSDNWRVASPGNFSANGHTFDSSTSREHGVLLTTSLDGIAVPDDELHSFVEKYLKKFVRKSTNGVYLLSADAELALDVCFTSDSKEAKCFVLRSEDLFAETYLAGLKMLMMLPHSLMRPGFPLGLSGWIMGTRFLRRYYSVFDWGSTLPLLAPRVGLGLKNRPASRPAQSDRQSGRSPLPAHERARIWT
ncbi:unnamed protein product [Amoebophrya sp. A25]|nr:unnamed protein product [Amoebophrya sp. A25]|eukprot:GSA25T00000586001.1